MDALIHQQIQQLSETRANIYWWFSTLYASTIDEEKLVTLLKDDDQKVLQTLCDSPSLTLVCKRFQRHIQPLLALEFPAQSLERDYIELFMPDSDTGTLPYASIYHSEEPTLFQEPHFEMLQRLEDVGLSTQANFKEPADHLAIQLDYLGNVILQNIHQPSHASVQNQKHFIQCHLLNWLPAFLLRMKQVRNSGVYQSLTDLMIHYLQQDLRSL